MFPYILQTRSAKSQDVVFSGKRTFVWLSKADSLTTVLGHHTTRSCCVTKQLSGADSR